METKKINAHYLIKFSTHGEWNILNRSTIAKKMIEDKGLDVYKTMDGFLSYLAKEFTKELALRIRTQKNMSRYTPLAKRTVKKKGHSKKYIDTGALLKSLTNWKIKDVDTDYHTYYVGFSKSIHPNSTLTNDEIGTILNFGSAKVPARPVLSDTARSLSKNITRHLERYIKTVGQ